MGDTSRYITYFKVENFKRFESFEMKDLGQFNLIVGDNNVGKTSVLEALLINGNQYQTFNSLIGALSYRKLVNNYTFKDISIYKNVSATGIANVYQIDITYKNNDESVEHINILIDNNQQELVYESNPSNSKSTKVVNGFTQVINLSNTINFPFIPFYRGHDEDLTKFYGRLQQDRSLKNKVLEYLKVLLPEIENIEPTHLYEKPHLIIYQRHMNKTLPLAMFGDGTLKLFRLLAEIILNNGSRLMIDEIDTGIHFSRFREFWKVVLLVAKENDVQLFMTTHNEECIKYFKEVLENDLPELQSEVRSIALIENPKTKAVKSFTYKFEELEANINVGNEIRG
jgi:AAA15 family ATPase/GTPase